MGNIPSNVKLITTPVLGPVNLNMIKHHVLWTETTNKKSKDMLEKVSERTDKKIDKNNYCKFGCDDQADTTGVVDCHECALCGIDEIPFEFSSSPHFDNTETADACGRKKKHKQDAKPNDEQGDEEDDNSEP